MRPKRSSGAVTDLATVKFYVTEFEFSSIKIDVRHLVGLHAY